MKLSPRDWALLHPALLALGLALAAGGGLYAVAERYRQAHAEAARTALKTRHEAAQALAELYRELPVLQETARQFAAWRSQGWDDPSGLSTLLPDTGRAQAPGVSSTLQHEVLGPVQAYTATAGHPTWLLTPARLQLNGSDEAELLALLQRLPAQAGLPLLVRGCRLWPAERGTPPLPAIDASCELAWLHMSTSPEGR